MLRAILHKVATVLDAILIIRNCSMMTRWHHSDSSKARSAEHKSVKKKTLDLSSRSKWFSAGLAEQPVNLITHNPSFTHLVYYTNQIPGHRMQ